MKADIESDSASFCEIGSLQVDGDKAEARSYCQEIVAMKGGNLMKVIAQYDDQLVKIEGAWLFSCRRYTVLIREAGAAK